MKFENIIMSSIFEHMLDVRNDIVEVALDIEKVMNFNKVVTLLKVNLEFTYEGDDIPDTKELLLSTEMHNRIVSGTKLVQTADIRYFDLKFIEEDLDAIATILSGTNVRFRVGDCLMSEILENDYKVPIDVIFRSTTYSYSTSG